MTTKPQTNDVPFGYVADGFVALLYGASVHLVIAEFIFKYSTRDIGRAFVLLLVILYLFSDWFSRFRLPRTPGKDISIGHRLAKNFLEAADLVFLVLAAVAVATDETQAALPFFVVFLFLTYLWNLVVFHAIDFLDLMPLIKGVLQGKVIEIEAVKLYAHRFHSAYLSMVRLPDLAETALRPIPDGS